MDLDELQSVQSRERQTDSLQQLRESFYAEASEYVQQLRESRDRAAERADDPWDNPEVNRLSDEINTAEQTVEAIYDRRTGKIVKKASLAAAGMPTEEEGLTAEEQDLFESLVDQIESNRDHVLDMIAGDVSPEAMPTTGSTTDETQPETESTTDAPTPPPESPESDAGVSAADVMGTNEDSDAPTPPPEPDDDPSAERAPPTPPHEREDAAASPDDDGEDAPQGETAGDEAEPTTIGEPSATTEQSVDRTTVRITQDVGEILGVDQRAYDLSTDDVVTLPEANAGPLVERDAAEQFD